MSADGRRRLRVTAAAVATGAIAAGGTVLVTTWTDAVNITATASTSPAAHTAGAALNKRAASPATPAASGAVMPGATPAERPGTTPVRLTLTLGAMAAGTVTTGTMPSGRQFVTVDVYGLTPGSAHEVTLRGNPVGMLTANAAGQAAQAFQVPGGIRLFDRVRILDGGAGSAVIAVSAATGTGNGPYPLRAAERGFGDAVPRGTATFGYDPATSTITITLSATGVSPGAHAAHLHLGSCASQGPVRYMLTDFTADASGVIDHETRTVKGVTIQPPAAGWYLNLHQGSSSDIVSGGRPTVSFRPLLCANI